MTLPADLNVYISAAMFVLGAFVLAIYVGMIVWTVRDIRSRTRDILAHILATLLVAVLTLPGLLIYVLLRPHTTVAEEYERSLAEEALLQELEERRVCPGCRHRVEADFIVCPYCHHQLRLRCVGCGRLLDPRWDVCPYCGRMAEQGQPADDGGAGSEPAPAANPVSPTRETRKREREAARESSAPRGGVVVAPSPQDRADLAEEPAPLAPLLPEQSAAVPNEGDLVTDGGDSPSTSGSWRPTRLLASEEAEPADGEAGDGPATS